MKHDHNICHRTFGRSHVGAEARFRTNVHTHMHALTTALHDEKSSSSDNQVMKERQKESSSLLFYRYNSCCSTERMRICWMLSFRE